MTPTSPGGGTWTLTSVRCDGVARGHSVLGTISVTLTAANPNQTCVFTDTFTATPTPTPPPGGGVLPSGAVVTPPATSGETTAPASQTGAGWIVPLLVGGAALLVAFVGRRRRSPRRG